MTQQLKFPIWLTALIILFIINNLIVFGLLSLFYPHLAFPDAGASAAFPIEFFAIRHIAFSLPLAYGLWKKDTKILLTCFYMFLVLSGLDAVLLFVKGYYVPVIGHLPLWGKIILSLGGFIGMVSLGIYKLTLLDREARLSQAA